MWDQGETVKSSLGVSSHSPHHEWIDTAISLSYAADTETPPGGRRLKMVRCPQACRPQTSPTRRLTSWTSTCTLGCSVLTLCCPMDCSPLGSSAHGNFQARILKCVPFPAPEDFPDPETEPVPLGSCTGRWILYHSATWESIEINHLLCWIRDIKITWSLYISVSSFVNHPTSRLLVRM